MAEHVARDLGSRVKKTVVMGGWHACSCAARVSVQRFFVVMNGAAMAFAVLGTSCSAEAQGLGPAELASDVISWQAIWRAGRWGDELAGEVMS